LVLAERSGLRIHEVPVDWVDDPDSRVDIVATATADLKGIGRMLRGFAAGSIPVNAIAAQLGSSRLTAAPGSLFRQVVRFGAVGVASTAAYVVLFVLMQAWVGAQAANLIALLLTAIGNTAANRRFTFGIGGRAKATRHHFEGLMVFGIALTITSGALAGLHLLVAQPHHLLELAVLVIANLVATAVRFVLLRGWVFHPGRSH
jgi:putative flippase GtrA